MAKEKNSLRGAPRFELMGGPVCLDFVNTLDNRPSQPKELLKRFVDLLWFCQDTGLLSEMQVNRLIERSYLAQDMDLE